MTGASTQVVDVTTPEGGPAGTAELPGHLFDAPANIPLMHQVVVAQLAAARAGTHSTRDRGDVAGGSAKPYRQKGTGRARQGSVRAPQFTGGGVAHGPVPRNYGQRTPKKMKAAALRGALSDRARDGRVAVVSAVVSTESPSTKAARRTLETVSDGPVGGLKLLVVLGRSEQLAAKSLRNLARVHVLYADQLNTYDVLDSDEVVFTRPALDVFVGHRGDGATAQEESQ